MRRELLFLVSFKSAGKRLLRFSEVYAAPEDKLKRFGRRKVFKFGILRVFGEVRQRIRRSDDIGACGAFKILKFFMRS